MALPPCRRAVALHELGAAGALFIRTDDGCGQCEFPANALRCRSAGRLLDGSLFESGLNVLDRLCHSVREGETFQRGDALAQTASMSLLGFLPVALFLLSLLYLDSYKLVTLRLLIILILIGCVAAGASLYFNHLLLTAGLQRRLLMRFGAPVIEEILKAVPIFWMIRSSITSFSRPPSRHSSSCSSFRRSWCSRSPRANEICGSGSALASTSTPICSKRCARASSPNRTPVSICSRCGNISTARCSPTCSATCS